jgi:hypothetical protein
MNMSFEEYLKNKKIFSEAFRDADPERWAQWKAEFEQMHPESFTAQKKNWINKIRRKYIPPKDLAER